jgi:hypothetical protein
VKDWPSDDKLVDFDELIEEVELAIKHGYKLKRLNNKKPFVYKGYNTPSVLAMCPPPNLRFTKEFEKQQRDQGRDYLQTCLLIMYHLGLENGIRIQKKDTIYWKGCAERSEQLLDIMDKLHKNKLAAMTVPAKKKKKK